MSSCATLQIPFSVTYEDQIEEYSAQFHVKFITEDAMQVCFKLICLNIQNEIKNVFKGIDNIKIAWNKLEIYQKADRCNVRIHMLVNGSCRLLESYQSFKTTPFSYHKDLKLLSSKNI